VSGASSALAFLQVVSKAMLDPGQDEQQNWCFKEYCAYKSGDIHSRLGRDRRRLFIFLIAERAVHGRPAEAVKPFADLREGYKPWHDHMLELATATLACISRAALKEQIESVAQQIHLFRHSVLDSVVPDEFAVN
jgi:hypothetical protein